MTKKTEKKLIQEFRRDEQAAFIAENPDAERLGVLLRALGFGPGGDDARCVDYHIYQLFVIKRKAKKVPGIIKKVENGEHTSAQVFVVFKKGEDDGEQARAAITAPLHRMRAEILAIFGNALGPITHGKKRVGAIIVQETNDERDRLEAERADKQKKNDAALAAKRKRAETANEPVAQAEAAAEVEELEQKGERIEREVVRPPPQRTGTASVSPRQGVVRDYVVEDEEAVPADYYTLDRARVLADLRKGITIPGIKAVAGEVSVVVR